MKILVVGMGWTGRKMFNELKNRGVELYTSSHQDCFPLIMMHKPDVVVNCAGVTGVPNVDACEDNKWDTFVGNTLFPISLSELCEARGCKLAHFSSGCIYEGQIDDVEADPNFFGSTYSISKAISDQHLVDTSMVFRIRMPFTNIDEPKNYLTKIKNYAKNGKLWNGGLNSLTDHNEAIRVAADYILEDAPIGPYNLVNKGAIDLKEICEIMNIQGEWYTDEEFFAATKCKRSNCIIPADNKMKDIREALYENRF